MDQKESKHFFCKQDRYYFKSSEWYEDDNGVFSSCQICNQPTSEVPHYYANLSRMWNNATGPRTDQGKKRSSLNNFKTGETSKHFHLLAPAIKGKFSECTGCQYYDDCGTAFKYCPVLIGPMMTFVQAFEEGRVEDLKSFAGVSHARIFQILSLIFKDVFEKGTLNPKVIKTTYEKSDDDEPTERETTLEWQANPLLKRIPELMIILGLSAEQQQMTPKAKQEQDNADGFLEAEKNKTQTTKEFEERRIKAMENLKERVTAAAARRGKDDILGEFENEDNKSDEK